MNKITDMKSVLKSDALNNDLTSAKTPLGIPVVAPFLDWDYDYLNNQIA